MTIEAVIAHLESTDEGKALVDIVKAQQSAKNEAEKTVRQQKTILDQFEGVDMKDLTAKAKLVDEHGGAEGILGKIAKADGYDNDTAKLKQTIDEYKANVQASEEKYSKAVADNERLSTVNEYTPIATSIFGADRSKEMTELAMAQGVLIRSESGALSVKDGDSVFSVSTAEGQDYLKRKYAAFVPKLEGGNMGGGVNDNSDSGNGKNKPSVADKLNEMFK